MILSYYRNPGLYQAVRFEFRQTLAVRLESATSRFGIPVGDFYSQFVYLENKDCDDFYG